MFGKGTLGGAASSDRRGLLIDPRDYELSGALALSLADDGNVLNEERLVDSADIVTLSFKPADRLFPIESFAMIGHPMVLEGVAKALALIAAGTLGAPFAGANLGYSGHLGAGHRTAPVNSTPVYYAPSLARFRRSISEVELWPSIPRPCIAFLDLSANAYCRSIRLALPLMRALARAPEFREPPRAP